MEQVVVAPPVEMLIVNQGPVYAGPGPYVTQRNFIADDRDVPYGYPYVGYVPTDTYWRGHRDFYSGSFYGRDVGHYRPRYRVARMRAARPHRALHPYYR